MTNSARGSIAESFGRAKECSRALRPNASLNSNLRTVVACTPILKHFVISFPAEGHGFDLLQHKADLGLDLYGAIKLINYVRRSVEAQGGSVERFALPGNIKEVLSTDERYVLGKRGTRGHDLALLR